MPENTAPNTERKFYLIMGILFSLLYFLTLSGIFRKLHIHVPFFEFYQLFYIAAVAGMMYLLRPLLDRVTILWFRAFLFLQGATFLLALLLKTGAVKADNANMQMLVSAIMGISMISILTAFGILLKKHWNELANIFRIWIVFFGILCLLNLFFAIAKFLTLNPAQLQITFKFWYLLSLLNPLLAGSLFVRELSRTRKEYSD